MYLRCGSVFRQTLKLGTIQIVNGSKVLSYGTNCNANSKPVISGADDISGGWVKNGNLWSKKLKAGTPKIKRIFVNGLSQRTAQWPDSDVALARPDSPTSQTVLLLTDIDAQALSGKDLQNATAFIRSEPWYIETKSVYSFDASRKRLTVAGNTQYPMEGHDGFVLQDKLWMLNAPGEFFHDEVSQTIYLYPSDSGAQLNLNGALVEAPVRARPLDITGRSDLNVENISVKHSSGEGIYLYNTSGIVLNSVESSGNRSVGLQLTLDASAPASSRRSSIKNSKISNNWYRGIDTEKSPRTDIISNQVLDTGTIDNPGGSSAAITAGEGALVSSNTVSNSSYQAIRFSGKDSSQVVDNIVRGYCKRLTDCGGIYTWNGPREGQNLINQKSTVARNRLDKVSPNLRGAGPLGEQVIVGIYLDDFSRGVTVRDNTVFGATHGIYLHNTSNSYIFNNKLWLNTSAGIWLRMDQAEGDYLKGNTLEENQIVPLLKAEGAFPSLPLVKNSLAFKIQHPLESGIITSRTNLFILNQIYELGGNSLPLVSIGNGQNDRQLLKEQWLRLAFQEIPPQSPIQYNAFMPTQTGEELIPTGTFSSGLSHWKFWTSSGISNLLSWVESGQAQVKFQTKEDIFYSPEFLPKASRPYVLKFRTFYNQSATMASPTLTFSSTPWSPNFASGGGPKSVSSLQGSEGDSLEYLGFFAANQSIPSRINFQSLSPANTVQYDNISLKEVLGYRVLDINEVAQVVLSEGSVSCTTLGWGTGCAAIDIHGNVVPLPLNLTSGETQIFLRTTTSWKVDNK